MDFSELKKTIEEMEIVDGHAHNLVALDSNFAFIHAFSLAHGDDALASTQHSQSFKRNLRDVAELYGCGSTLEAVEEHRNVSGLESIASTCFKAARISTVIFDDGIDLDKIIDTEWHKTFTPHVAALVRIERLAEKILNQLSGNLQSAYGYGAPEFESGTYTYQSDVYSVGVVMLELLTGRQSHDSSLPRGEQFLARWAIPKLHDIDALSKMVDPSLNGVYPAKSLSNFADIISRCLQVMFSTDAYAFPELFYLGAKNARKVVFTVLRDSCIDGDLTVSEAVEAAKDLFARNSINFYKIIS